MKEELLRVLNVKLDDINKNIDSLVELNEKINTESNHLAYIRGVLERFKNEDGFDILNIVKINKDDFNKSLDIVSGDIKDKFNDDGCNFDGLVYLINGINNGVSLTLTDEQKESIDQLIQGLSNKESEYESIIDGLMHVKNGFPINDINLLENEKEIYTNIINKLNSKEYITSLDKVTEAMDFSNITDNMKINILSFLLGYNAEVFKNKKNDINVVENKEVTENDVFNFKPVDISNNEKNVAFSDVYVENNTIESNNKEISETKKDFVLPTEGPITFEPLNLKNQSKEDNDLELNFDVPREDNQEFDFIIPNNNQDNEIEVNSSENNDKGINETNIETDENAMEDTSDNEFSDVMDSSDYEEEDKTSSRELQRLFSEYNLNEDLNSSELIDGNVNNYRDTLDTLKNNSILDDFVINKELFQEVLLYSGKEEIIEVLSIIKNDLSVDEDDYKITLAIAINTIPTIFIKDGGSFDNFVNNTKLFKQIGINLIKLFDFSKEVFIIDNERMVNNYEIVKKYNINIDYNNIKYFLVLPNIDERMDYYVESVYPDKTKNNEMFDGITFINNYSVKLNNVCDLIIKRLRYASENSHKVFGSKPNSLTGEITNLKVDVLSLDDEYLSKFLNNHFDGITLEETREFIKLIRNSSNVGNYADELDMLEKYHKGLRYVIEGINISYNKVNRIYSILRSYGITNNKALHFALCYNLVITKDEYNKLKNVINELGGNL